MERIVRKVLLAAKPCHTARTICLAKDNLYWEYRDVAGSIVKVYTANPMSRFTVPYLSVPCRMLKKSVGGVHIRHSRLTVSPARTTVALFLHRAVRLVAWYARRTSATLQACAMHPRGA